MVFIKREQEITDQVREAYIKRHPLKHAEGLKTADEIVEAPPPYSLDTGSILPHPTGDSIPTEQQEAKEDIATK